MMEMTKEELLVLYEKFISGKYTDEDLKKLENYRGDFSLTESEWKEGMGDREEIYASLLRQLQQNMHKKRGLHKVFSGKFKHWAAAAVLLLASAVLFLYLKRSLGGNEQIVRSKEIRPGRNKAVLRLDDGSEIVLNDVKAGILKTFDNARVTKSEKGGISYSVLGHGTSVKTVYNTIETPAGGEYQIALSDGTLVWLNASSSLRFPTQFDGDSRQVELRGEAYFEVAKNKQKPFKVALSNGAEVRVLGTHFDIMSYADEDAVRTTLVSGAVEIDKGPNRLYLHPGEQGSINRNDENIEVKKVNVDDVIAWKKGYFIFRNEDLYHIMRQVSRWYDVEVIFRGNLDNRNFMGSISRSRNLSEVLKVMEITGTVHFKLEGRRVIVMP